MYLGIIFAVTNNATNTYLAPCFGTIFATINSWGSPCLFRSLPFHSNKIGTTRFFLLWWFRTYCAIYCNWADKGQYPFGPWIPDLWRKKGQNLRRIASNPFSDLRKRTNTKLLKKNSPIRLYWVVSSKIQKTRGIQDTIPLGTGKGRPW